MRMQKTAGNAGKVEILRDSGQVHKDIG